MRARRRRHHDAEAGRAAALAACPQVDILVNNAGGPPPGDFRDWDRDAWIKALDANMLTPIELIKATVDAMAARGFGRIVNITSGAVKAPIDMLGLSNGARSGLTGFVAGLARSGIAARGVTINGLLPGVVRHRPAARDDAARLAKSGQTIDEIARRAAAQAIPAQRFGTADEFGAVCAFLCSVHAGYITGQNMLIDGGAYPARSESGGPLDAAGHRCAAVPALLERRRRRARRRRGRPSADAPDGAARRAAARARSSCVVVADPDLGQRLVGRQLAGDAARVHALHRRRRCRRA